MTRVSHVFCDVVQWTSTVLRQSHVTTLIKPLALQTTPHQCPHRHRQLGQHHVADEASGALSWLHAVCVDDYAALLTDCSSVLLHSFSAVSSQSPVFLCRSKISSLAPLPLPTLITLALNLLLHTSKCPFYPRGQLLKPTPLSPISHLPLRRPTIQSHTDPTTRAIHWRSAAPAYCAAAAKPGTLTARLYFIHHPLDSISRIILCISSQPTRMPGLRPRHHPLSAHRLCARVPRAHHLRVMWRQAHPRHLRQRLRMELGR